MRFGWKWQVLALGFWAGFAVATRGDDPTQAPYMFSRPMYLPPEYLPPGVEPDANGQIIFPTGTVLTFDENSGEIFPLIPDGPEEAAALSQIGKDDLQANDRLRAKGIDPDAYFRQANDPARSVAMARAVLQQRLVDEGVLDGEALARRTALYQRIALTTIRRRIGSSDEEWAIILPKMMNVVAVLSDAGQLSKADRRLATSFLMAPPSPPLARAIYRLLDALSQRETALSKIAVCLGEYRQIRDRAKAAYDQSAEDLRGVLTLRQEAILLDLGILN